MEFQTWDEFKSFLFGLHKKEYKNKKQACLISPAVYSADSKRLNSNVLYWGKWAALDIDSIDIKYEDLKNDLYNRIGDWSYICYSTASSTYDKPKFRLVVQLSESVGNDKIRALWWALNTKLESVGDRQTKDLSRMYYVPGTYCKAFNFMFCNDGNPVNVNDLIREYPIPEKPKSFFDKLPDDMKKAILSHKRNMLDKDYSWSSYKDCPFISKKVLDDYIKTTYSKDSGRYHTMYNLMVSIASNAISSGYPITPNEIGQLCRQIDMDTGRRYPKRPFEVEAERAINYSFTKNI